MINISSQNTMYGDTPDQDLDELRNLKYEKEAENDPVILCQNSNKIPKPCEALLVLHFSFRNRDFNGMKNTRANDMTEAMSNISQCMDVLMKDVEKFKSECDEVESQYDISDCKDLSLDNSVNIQQLNNSNNISENIHHSPGYNITTQDMCNIDNKQEFKLPVIEIIKNRVSSSTSSSSLWPSSIIDNRHSSTSTFSHSDGSADVQKADSDEMLISETSISAGKSDMGIEDTLIENEEENEYFNVYAKWKTDKFFYSGRAKINKTECEVIFDDKTSEIVKINDILLMEMLPKGIEVSVETDKRGNFENNYVIKDYVEINRYRGKPVNGYSVLNQVTNKCRSVSRECVSVHMDIVKKIIGRNTEILDLEFDNLNSSDISMDNIQFGKRAPKRKRFSQFITTENYKKCASPSINNLSISSFSYKPKPLKKSYLTKSWRDDSFLHLYIGLFTNCYFMITGEEDENDSKLSKETIEKIINTHYGKVIEMPTDDLIKKYRQNQCKLALLVLGKETQTIKFMVSLAIGEMPIISLNWLLKSVQQKKILDYESFLLPRGMTQSGQLVSLNLNEKYKSGVFSNKTIWIVTDNIEIFGTNWQTILKISGAEVFIMDTSKFSSSIYNDNCNFVVVEKDGVTNNCLKRLRNLGITIVDISYVIECLISNNLLEFDNYIL